jgi:protoporphyrinogen oxidase
MILFDSEAKSIEQNQGKISVAIRKDKKDETVEGDFLISTIPITNLLKILKPLPPVEISRLADSLRYRALLLLFLCLNKERALDYQCIYFTENKFPFRRITEFKNLDNSMAPPGKTSLCVEITCFEDDEIFKRDSEAILKDVVKQLEISGFIKTNEIEKYFLLRIPYAYPVYDIHYNIALDKILNYLGIFDKLISIGRQGLFSYNTMSNSILMGYDLGQRLSTAQKDDIKRIIHSAYDERKEKYES